MLPLWVSAHTGIHANATSHMYVMPPNCPLHTLYFSYVCWNIGKRLDFGHCLGFEHKMLAQT
jgi:hypothetical protein